MSYILYNLKRIKKAAMVLGVVLGLCASGYTMEQEQRNVEPEQQNLRLFLDSLAVNDIQRQDTYWRKREDKDIRKYCAIENETYKNCPHFQTVYFRNNTMHYWLIGQVVSAEFFPKEVLKYIKMLSLYKRNNFLKVKIPGLIPFTPCSLNHIFLNEIRKVPFRTSIEACISILEEIKELYAKSHIHKTSLEYFKLDDSKLNMNKIKLDKFNSALNESIKSCLIEGQNFDRISVVSSDYTKVIKKWEHSYMNLYDIMGYASSKLKDIISFDEFPYSPSSNYNAIVRNDLRSSSSSLNS